MQFGFEIGVELDDLNLYYYPIGRRNLCHSYWMLNGCRWLVATIRSGVVDRLDKFNYDG